MAKKTAIKLLSPISNILGVSPVLPGENADLYESGLVATIEELEAKTPFQIYLAEKIFDCLWWIRRYEEQKRAVLISEMASILDSRRGATLEVSDFKKWVFDELYANRLGDELREAIESCKHSLESLRQLALSRCVSKIRNLDEMIALNTKTLAGFQASYEVLANRKINRDRLRLQNEILQRDLGAIAHDDGQATTSK